MNVRKILVAASAAAILASTSYGALAGSWGVSKGQSSSTIHVVAKADPTDNAWYSQKGTKVDVWGKGWQSATAPSGGSAGSTSSSHGGGIAIEANVGSYGAGSATAAWGGTSGSACAGSACSNPPTQY
jgi:hypothetical protein